MISNGATKANHEGAGANTLPKTKALSVIMQNFSDESHFMNTWRFHTTDIGVSAICRSDDQAVAEKLTSGDYKVDTPPWPQDTFPITIDGLGDCEYKNDGSNPRALWCGER
jgi:hypothetical protein